MKYTLDKYVTDFVTIINELELEANEFFYLLITYNGQIKELIEYCAAVKDENMLVTRMVEGKKVKVPKNARLAKENIERLIEKELISYEGYDKEFNLENLTLTPKAVSYLDRYYKTKAKTHAKAFYDAYPNLSSGEKIFPIKTTITEDEAIALYEQVVNDNEHENLLRYVKLNSHEINLGIDKFLRNGLFRDMMKNQSTQVLSYGRSKLG